MPSFEIIMLGLLIVAGIIVFIAYVWFIRRIRQALKEKDDQRRKENIRRYKVLLTILSQSEKTAKESLKTYEKLLGHHEKGEIEEFSKILSNKINDSRKDHMEWYERNIANLKELRDQFKELKKTAGKGKKIEEGIARVKSVLDEREKMIEGTKKELDMEVEKLEEIKAGKIDLLKVIISDMRGKLKSGHIRKESERAIKIILDSAKKEGISREELGL